MMLQLILFLCLIFIIAIYDRYKLQYWKRRKVPYKTPYPFLGNVIDYTKYLFKLDHNDDKINYYNAFGEEKYYGIYLFHRPMLVLKDPELIKCVLVTNFNNFTDRYDFGNDFDILMQNLITFGGEKWKTLRQKLIPMFTPNKIKRMFNLVLKQAESTIKYIEKNELNSDNTETLKIMQIYTLNLIGSIGFGLKFTAETDQNTKYHKTGYSLFKSDILNVIRFGIRINLTSISNFFGLRVFSKKTEDFFLDMTKNIIDSRNGVSNNRDDFIDLLLELKNEEKIDYKFVAAQSFTFFSAGFETTSINLANILYELAHDSVVQDKLYIEIDEALKKTSYKITYETIGNMPYMEAVISETLRKYPGTVMFPRTCSKSFRLPNTDLYIEKGMQIVIPLIGLHHDPKYYPEPEKFKPERFIDDKTKTQSMVYLPFSTGPRSCIAVRFAQLQTKIALTLILDNFKVIPCSKSEYPPRYHAPMMVPKPKNGLWLKFTKRKLNTD